MLLRSPSFLFVMLLVMCPTWVHGVCTLCSTTSSGTWYCPSPLTCGSIINAIQYCSDGSKARNSACCFANRNPIPSLDSVQQATCSSTEPRQQFTYNPTDRTLSLPATSGGGRTCLEVYWGEFCAQQPTAILFYGCDAANRPSQTWDRSGSSIKSGRNSAFCLSTATNQYRSQASAQSCASIASQSWVFDWNDNVGTLKNVATGKCLQKPAPPTTTAASTPPPSSSAVWNVATYYVGGCSGTTPVAIVAAKTGSSCTSVSCTAVSGTSLFYAVTCPSSQPSVPSNMLSSVTYPQGGGTCTGSASEVQAARPGMCVPSGGGSQKYTCDSSSAVTVRTYASSTTCSGSSSVSTTPVGCNNGVRVTCAAAILNAGSMLLLIATIVFTSLFSC